MSFKPKVTVVTVTYNAEQFLEQTIKSVIEQGYPNIEYIIIDGASSDETVKIIKKYGKHISYWVSEPDSGIYEAMNKGIDRATGEWINFLNAGDSFVEKNTISKVVKEMHEDVEIIAGDIFYVENDKKTYKASARLEDKLKGMFCSHQAMFTKIGLMRKYRFNTAFKIAGDYDFALKCAMNQHRFKFISLPVANFLADGLSETNRLFAKVEDLFIQSKYIKNKDEIFNLFSYSFIKSQDTSSNSYLFAHLMNSFYKWLDTLDLSKTYLLYGYGHIGKIVYENLKPSIKAIVDRSYKDLSSPDLTIYNPSDIADFEFDHIIISVLGREDDITKYLVEDLKVSRDKIMRLDLKNV